MRIKTALGIFFRLQVLDFDLFFGFLVLVFHFSFLLLGCLLIVLRQ
jgi:hypothetical protein